MTREPGVVGLGVEGKSQGVRKNETRARRRLKLNEYQF